MSPANPTFSIKARNMSALAALCVVVIHAGGNGMGSAALPLAHPAWWAYVLRAILVAALSLWLANLLHRFLPRESHHLFGGR